jgi:hypothetical protein
VTTTTTSTDAAVRSPASTPLTRRRSRTTAILEQIDWDALSPRALAIATTFAPLISAELTGAEIATYFGKPSGWVTAQMRFLRRELEAQLERPERAG